MVTFIRCAGFFLLLAACSGVAKGPEAPEIVGVIGTEDAQIRAYTDVTRIIETHPVSLHLEHSGPVPIRKPLRKVETRSAKVKKPEPTKVAQKTTLPLTLPPNPRAGACYAQVEYAPNPEVAVVHVPAVYEWVEEKVEVTPAKEVWQTIPAVYKTVSEQVMTDVQEPVQRVETVTEQILVTPARTEWKPGRGAIERVDGHTGQIMCLVEIPAVYKTITKQISVESADTRTVSVPVDVQRQVLVTPAKRQRVIIPPVYETRQVKRLVRPAYERLTSSSTAQLASSTSGPAYQWQEVVCETNMSPAFVASLQSVLTDRGFYSGDADGLYGPLTHQAVQRFQQSAGLPTESLGVDTVQMLGLNPRLGQP